MSGRDDGGFTLVEVMVALAVVAVALTALLRTVSTHLDGSYHLRDKLLAQWVALNQVELARLDTRRLQRLPARSSSGSAELGGRRWHWRAELEGNGASGAAQWHIRVAAAPADPPLAEISILLDTGSSP